MRPIRLIVAGTAITIATAACGPTLQTTLEPQWTVPVAMEEYETAEAADDGSLAVVADEKDVRIVDGNGRVVYEEEPEGGLLSGLRDQVSIGGVSLDDIEGGNRYGYAFVPGSDLVLLFDNTLNREEVRALSASTGEVAWQSDDYLWSLEQYGRVGEALLGAITGTSARGQAGIVLAFTKFVSDLVEPVPELDGFLMNTVSDLKLMEAGTGREIWSVPQFDASGIGTAIYLEGANDLIVLARTRGTIETLTGAKRMIRVDAATGDVVWSTSYSGQPMPRWVQGDSILDVRVIDDRVLLNFMGAEAYDLDTGEQVFDALGDARGTLASATGASLIESAWTARPVVEDGVVYAHQAENFQAVGYPDQLVRGYDLRTGEMVWESEPIESMGDLRDLASVDGLLIARVTGSEPEGVNRGGALLEPGLGDRGYVAWDQATGDIVWTRRDLGSDVTNLVATGAGLFASDAESILRLDARTGETVESVDHTAAEVGDAGVLMEIGENLVALSSDGVVFYRMPDLATRNVILTDGIQSYAVRGDLLVVEVSDGAHAIDLTTGQEIGTIGDLAIAFSGNLDDGYHITDDGRSIFVLHPGTLAKYLTQ